MFLLLLVVSLETSEFNYVLVEIYYVIICHVMFLRFIVITFKCFVKI